MNEKNEKDLSASRKTNFVHPFRPKQTHKIITH